MKIGLLAGSVIAAALGCVSSASAQAWPTHPIQWIVPFDPGGGTDIVARLVGEKLSQRLGQPVVIINRPGANSEVGYKDTANAKPDGYTMVLTVPSVVTNTFYFQDSLDPKQLAPVIYLAEGSYVLLASSKFGAKSIDEVVKKIKDNPGRVSCGLTGGVGSIGCEMLEAKTKTRLNKIPYRGSNPGSLAVMQGEIDLVFNFSITAKSVVDSKRVEAIGTTAAKRGSQPYPELPAINEVLPGFEMAGWDGVMVPNGTPREIIMRLNQEINAVLQLPDVQKTLVDGGLQIVGGTPEDFARRLDDVQKAFGSVLSETGVKPE